jgi:lactobin A/cerein 7B family class IIb bacteriocin
MEAKEQVMFDQSLSMMELSLDDLEQAQGGVAPLVIAIVKGAAAAGAGALVYKALDAIFG